MTANIQLPAGVTVSMSSKGIPEGRRTDLAGGGLIRSAGGWSAVKALRKGAARMKSDERILGDGNFVEKVLNEACESLERKYKLEAQGYDFEWLVEHVAMVLNIEPEDVLARGKKYKKTVKSPRFTVLLGNAGDRDDDRSAGQKTKFSSANYKPISYARAKDSHRRRIKTLGTNQVIFQWTSRNACESRATGTFAGCSVRSPSQTANAPDKIWAYMPDFARDS